MTIIKIGGGETINLEAIINDLVNINDKFIVVHGANALRDNLAKKLDYSGNLLILNGDQFLYEQYLHHHILQYFFHPHAALRNGLKNHHKISFYVRVSPHLFVH